MTVLRGRKAEIKDKSCLLKGDELIEKNSVFGKYEDSKMLSQLKIVALNPCELSFSLDSIRPLWNQILRVRKVMALGDTEFPRRKRKLQQFLKDKFKSAARLASETSNQQNFTNVESSDQQIVTKLSRGQVYHASSASCMLNMADSIETLDNKDLLVLHSSDGILTFEDNLPRRLPKQGFSLVDSDESVNDSNLLTPEHGMESKQKLLQTPRRSNRLLNFVGDHLQRMAIPVGPRFQADIPEWSGSPNKVSSIGKDSDSDSSRWLGTRIWPIEGRNIKTTAKAFGKGRHNSCFCASQGSADCIKYHILKERRFLQSDLGPAFLSWKFDEMGEEVSKSWTLKEQQSFESLAKTCLQSNGKNFLKNATKCFASKCKKDILSYYFNVFIPRRMSLQNRSLFKQVGTDVDAVEDVYNLNLQERYKDRGSIMNSSKDMKTRFLRHR